MDKSVCLEELKAQVEDLQSRAAHQDDNWEKLNRVVAEQADAIQLLKQQLLHTHKKLVNLSEALPKNGDTEHSAIDYNAEKPPHY